MNRPLVVVFVVALALSWAMGVYGVPLWVRCLVTAGIGWTSARHVIRRRR